jgi:hypothetical protein
MKASTIMPHGSRRVWSDCKRPRGLIDRTRIDSVEDTRKQMDLTLAEAAEIAAECIAALEWQANFARNPSREGIPAGDMIAAVTPRRPATLRVIEAMKRSADPRAMKELMPLAGPDIDVVLLPSVCRSIVRNLAEWGFRHEAQQIMAALDQSDLAAMGH